MWSKINTTTDKLLNGITMYRLVLYSLLLLLTEALILGSTGLLSYNPVTILLSTVFLVMICLVTNDIFAKAYETPANAESAIITGLILALIISPIKGFNDLAFLGWAGVLAMSSKYILAINKKHIFNPAAIAVVLTALGINKSASWWAGNAWMIPLEIIITYLVARKIRRESMVLYFLGTIGAITLGYSIINGSPILPLLNKLFLHSSIFFFAGIMLTEPLTCPATKTEQNIFGVLTGILYTPQVHLGNIFFTPEMALAAGNIYAFVVSPKTKLLLKLKEKIKIAPDTYDFIFPLNKKINYKPGQYMEWTMKTGKNDDRGNRRYFTLASSPTEDNLRIGVKFYPSGSAFKESMLTLEEAPVMAGQLAGDFTMPKDKNKKLVLVAGGIGVTPFRSMVKYMLDKGEKRDVVVMYANRTDDEIVYKDIFDEAKEKLGIKTVYTLTDLEKVPEGWNCKTGRIDQKMIKEEVSDWRERIFYISGPQAMVNGTKEMLLQMGLTTKQIKTDYFPGF